MTETETELDLDDVAAWCLRQKWLGLREDSPMIRDRDFLPQLIELYRNERPRELRQEAEERARREEWARIAAESRAASARAAEHARLMRDMRDWGPKNGFFVGTRGRIPRKVIDAYNKAKGIT
ncbi:histone-like nucleoid-structuring protein Lsr2 [Streptomyces sp. NPDC046853]|uniref:Lsr2 family DNA-binding protein n=1 Tax=Streptomyces sp. NPDC046853 TaxID=3154920 RepID=UPI0033F52F9A